MHHARKINQQKSSSEAIFCKWINLLEGSHQQIDLKCTGGSSKIWWYEDFSARNLQDRPSRYQDLFTGDTKSGALKILHHFSSYRQEILVTGRSKLVVWSTIPEEGTKTLEFPPLTSSMPPVLSKPCKVHNVVRGIEKLFKKHPPSSVYMICLKLSYGTYQNSIYKSTKI